MTFVPSHLLYADDILLFCKGSRRNAETLEYAFDIYRKISRQSVNLENSMFYFGKGVSSRLEELIRSTWQLRRGFLPFNYLGVPLFEGKPKKEFLLPK